jgi:Ni,Fe-hydrogenase I cytochrome b subunit
MALVPVRTWHYASRAAIAMVNPRVGDGVYIELGNYEKTDLHNTLYFTNGYFVNAHFKFNSVVTMIHERGTRAPTVFLDPFALQANMMKSELPPPAKLAAVPTMRSLLRRSLLLRLLFALWRTRHTRRRRAAVVIQCAWREAWYNPNRGLCKRRLYNEWKTMHVVEFQK